MTERTAVYRVTPLVIQMVIGTGQSGASSGALQAGEDSGVLVGGFTVSNSGSDCDDFDRSVLIEQDTNLETCIRKNAEAADGSLIFYDSNLHFSALQTANCCHQLCKPFRLIDISLLARRNLLDELSICAKIIEDFILKNRIEILNIAGSSESECAGIERWVYDSISIMLEDAVVGSASEEFSYKLKNLTKQRAIWYPPTPHFGYETLAALAVPTTRPGVEPINYTLQFQRKIERLAKEFDEQNGEGAAYRVLMDLQLFGLLDVPDADPVAMSEQIIMTDLIGIILNDASMKEVSVGLGAHREVLDLYRSMDFMEMISYLAACNT